jgi:TolB-like protein
MPANALDEISCVKLSTIPENEYFTYGISDEFIDALAKVERLNETSNLSPFLVVERSLTTLSEILKHRQSSILQGSARLAGNAIAIIVLCIDAAIDFYFCSRTWDRKFDAIGANE